MSSSPPLHETVRCRRCGDVIGVYEPIVVVLDGETLLTSGADAGASISAHAECFHQACFDRDR